ncbi:MAG: Uma2 family endonuclease [Candidatus Poribacteria bacterium]
MVQVVEEIKQKENLTYELLEIFPQQGRWTEEYYFRLPETSKKIELSKGRLIITPAPTPKHQRISSRLYLLIGNFVLSKNLGEVCYSPLDVKLYEGIIRQPDIAFMSKDHLDRITEKYWGVPDLVIEILSESTITEDRTNKFFEYLQAGVSEYWIVDPDAQTIEVYNLTKGAYVPYGKWGIGEIAKSKLLEGFEVKVDDIMK